MTDPGGGARPCRFDAVLLASASAHARLAGLRLVERAAFTMARAGAGRVLIVGARPPGLLRLPPCPVAWIHPGDPPALATWCREGARVLVGLDASALVDESTVTALVEVPGGEPLRAAGEVVLWRCDATAFPVLAQAFADHLGTSPLASRPPGPTPSDRGSVPRPWRPPPTALCHPAHDASSRAAAARALLARSGRPGDSWFIRHVDRRISRALTRLLLLTRLTPNHVTLLSIAFGIAAGALFATSHATAALVGAGLFLLSTIVDGCDGEIARLTFRESALGARLDLAGDNVVHLALFGGIAAGAYRRSPTPLVAGLGILLIVGVVLSMAAVLWAFWWRQPTPAQRALFERVAGREFAYLLLVLTAAGRLEWFLWLAVIGTYVFVAALLGRGIGRAHA